MLRLKSTILTCILTVTIVTARAQINEQWEKNRHTQVQQGMLVLGSWALANMSVSGFGMYQGSGSNYYFHQMNVAWNAVNLSLAGVSLILNKPTDNPTFEQLASKSIRMEKTLLLNAGLDVAYIATGALLTQDRYTKHQTRNRGWGQSLVVQGGFLFAFDLVLHHKLHSLRKKQLPPHLSVNPYPGGLEITCQW